MFQQSHNTMAHQAVMPYPTPQSQYMEELDFNSPAVWSDTLFTSVGLSYLGFLSLGGAYGAFKGLRNTKPLSFKLKTVKVLNQVTRHGTRLGNGVAGTLLIANLLNRPSYWIRGTEDSFNWIPSGAAVGGMVGFNLVKRVRSPVVLGGVVLGSLSTFLWAGYQEKRFSDLSSVGTYVKELFPSKEDEDRYDSSQYEEHELSTREDTLTADDNIMTADTGSKELKA